MKVILSVFILLCIAACGDVDVEPAKMPMGEKWNFGERAETTDDRSTTSTDGKADEYHIPLCVVEDVNDGCDVIGADCCDAPGFTCQEYTIYDRFKCLPSVEPKKAALTKVQLKTRGDVMDCISSFTEDGTSLDVVISTPKDELGNGNVDLYLVKIIENFYSEEASDRVVENGGAALKSSIDSPHMFYDLTLDTFYHNVSLRRIEGYKGVYQGQINSIIRDESWEVVCWEPEIEVRARYDELSGDCSDGSGMTAINPELGPEFIRGSGFGECMTLTSELNEGFYNYNTWESPRLAGSDLSNASLHFANIANADLRGTNLEGFDFGYANITGSIDNYTRFDASCSVEATELICRR